MAEHTEAFEWRADGEEAEAVVYAPDDEHSERALRLALPATSLPGVSGCVFAAASAEGAGRAALSGTHTAPGLVSVPARGLLLASDRRVEETEAPFDDLEGIVRRRLAEALASLPSLGEPGVRRVCEEGAWAAAEDGLIEDEDVPFLGPLPGDPDALGRRALAAGVRAWKAGIEPELAYVDEIVDAPGAERIGLEGGMVTVMLSMGGGDLGRLALGTHEERITVRVRAGADFGAASGLPAAPVGTEEAADLLAALGAASNFADARAAAAVAALRRASSEFTGGLSVLAAWRVGGMEERTEGIVHRDRLCARGNGEATVSGSSVVVGAGKMLGSVPPFGVAGRHGRWAWEEAGLVERLAILGGTGG